MTRPSIPYSPMPQLRPFQQKLEADIYAAWQGGAVNVMPCAATGSGKTVVLSKCIKDNDAPSVAIAHRQELVSQMSLALARNEVRHRIIGPDSVQRICRQIHISELGHHYVDPNARAAVAGVDTLVRLVDDAETVRWARGVTLQVQDEGHHVLAANKWGRAAAMFPNARGLFPTATPVRADGRGLGRHADGLTDALVLAPTMREIINMGYLTDYRIFAPPSDLDLSNVSVGASGDFVREQLSAAVKKSHLTGDVVAHYIKLARGKLGVTFCADVEHATETAAAYRAADVPAEVVSAKTPDALRADILRRFKRREILQLVNVDLFGEGFDLPAIEVVSMARPTQSFSLYCQQFGRALRLMLEAVWFVNTAGVVRFDALTDEGRRQVIAQSSKPHALIIDHVSNVLRHRGPPDRRMSWSLDRREARASSPSEAIPYRVCPSCTRPYPRIYVACEHCGEVPEPATRSTPEAVDGDLFEYGPELLAFLRGEVERIDAAPPVSSAASGPVAGAIRRNHWERQQAQAALRQAMAWYSGLENARGRVDLHEQYRRFFFTFGVDALTALTLGKAEAEKLRERIVAQLATDGIDASVSCVLH